MKVSHGIRRWGVGLLTGYLFGRGALLFVGGVVLLIAGSAGQALGYAVPLVMIVVGAALLSRWWIRWIGRKSPVESPEVLTGEREDDLIAVRCPDGWCVRLRKGVLSWEVDVKKRRAPSLRQAVNACLKDLSDRQTIALRIAHRLGRISKKGDRRRIEVAIFGALLFIALAERPSSPGPPSGVVDLMEALKSSVEEAKARPGRRDVRREKERERVDA